MATLQRAVKPSASMQTARWSVTVPETEPRWQRLASAMAKTIDPVIDTIESLFRMALAFLLLLALLVAWSLWDFFRRTLDQTVVFETFYILAWLSGIGLVVSLAVLLLQEMSIRRLRRTERELLNLRSELAPRRDIHG